MLSVVASLIGSYLEARVVKKATGELATYLDNWARLIASIAISWFVTFVGIFGIAGGGVLAATKNPVLALASGLFSASAISAFVVWRLWTASPLTKGIAVAVPSEFAEAALQESVTTTER